MKPCRDKYRINCLIDYHRTMAQAHQVQINHHLERAEILNEYLNELNKPGFKQEGTYIITGTTQRAELFVTAASNSYEGGSLFTNKKKI